jgi:hypothetical protein
VNELSPVNCEQAPKHVYSSLLAQSVERETVNSSRYLEAAGSIPAQRVYESFTHVSGYFNHISTSTEAFYKITYIFNNHHRYMTKMISFHDLFGILEMCYGSTLRKNLNNTHYMTLIHTTKSQMECFLDRSLPFCKKHKSTPVRYLKSFPCMYCDVSPSES